MAWLNGYVIRLLSKLFKCRHPYFLTSGNIKLNIYILETVILHRVEIILDQC